MPTVLAETIAEELDARGWSVSDVALRMGGQSLREIAIDQLCVEMILAVDRPSLRIDEETAAKLGRAFDVSPGFFLRLQDSAPSCK